MENAMIIGIIFIYLTIAGFLHPKFKKYFEDGPPDMHESDASVAAFCSASLFPIALPVSIGKVISNYDREGRAEKRRSRELVNAKHERELAKLRAEEAEYVDRQLAASKRN